MDNKAQASLEFFGYYIILSTVFLIVMLLIVDNQKTLDDERTHANAKQLLVFAKNEIDIAINAGDGYSHAFILPETLKGRVNYTMLILPTYQLLYISYNDRNVSLPVLTDNITSGIKKGKNTIKNSKGMITFESFE
jgi:hypothetical protein